ncbi:hypothetical protein Vretimale_14192 [Volvox reticuliferus]|uniref:Uncharacterized protein n=1 Tax=Volvox reticuliferus TaxID=1737510 RepID=A0A8J4LUV5_9CHLO|nr:hypothetical protein Vretimale_14192 [Volvox reticuliferus]
MLLMVSEIPMCYLTHEPLSIRLFLSRQPKQAPLDVRSRGVCLVRVDSTTKESWSVVVIVMPLSREHPRGCGEDMGPTLDAVANDQGTEMERRTPTAAVTTVRTDRGHGIRGASGSGNPRGSAGAGQSSDLARGKRKGGTPSATVAHEAKNETKWRRTNDSWLKKFVVSLLPFAH